MLECSDLQNRNVNRLKRLLRGAQSDVQSITDDLDAFGDVGLDWHALVGDLERFREAVTILIDTAKAVVTELEGASHDEI